MKGVGFVVPAMVLTLTAVSSAAAQLIDVRTIPVAAGDQFRIFPSQRLGMGSVSIALDDSLLDPLSNPATAGRLRGLNVIAAPGFYNISADAGAARTLPVGLMGGSSRWFGGGVVALQQIQSGQPSFAFPVLERSVDFAPQPFPGQQTLSEQSANNLYGFGVVGTTLPGTRVSIGASAFLADLSGVDGVDLLYATSQGLDQYGYAADLRLGLSADWSGGRTLEAVLLHDRFSMTHDVSYLDWVYDSTTFVWNPVQRLESNFDKTNTWGLHVGYVVPVATGWRIGGILTGNRKSHPKIPNYELMNIPRDPGTTWAYNLGFGIARTGGPATFGVDFVYEPIRSHTWAEAAGPTATVRGDTIAQGGMTVENRFRFSNASIRLGVARDIDRATFQLGLRVRSINYRLAQNDYVAGIGRTQNEHWMEWTPTWGASVRFPEFELRYLGSVTTGTGRPGVAWSTGSREAAAGADFVVAPSGPLTLQDVKVVSHQFSIAMPLR